MDTSPATEAGEAVQRRLAAADIGESVLGRGLAEVDAIGPIRVESGTAEIPVTVPVPSQEARGLLAREIESAVAPVDTVEAVDVRFEPAVPDPGERVALVPDVTHVVAVGSGKGGVGKSTLASNLAVGLADAGAEVGLLDADVYGPNAPQMLGLADRTPGATQGDEIVPREAHGVKTMSIGFIAGEEDPVIWRGPLVDEFITQLFGDVAWGDLDYLVVDLPPGTGDAQLSLVQHVPVTGAVVVTTPQAVAVDDASRSLEGFSRYDVPILGIVENMAGFTCPDCGSTHDVFGSGGAAALAGEFDAPVLGQVPIDPGVGQLEAEADAPDPPGVTLPGIGRLQLPRTQDERERPTSTDPVVRREGAGETRTAVELVVTRTAVRVNEVAGAEPATQSDGS
ncbi:MAG: Mrp/NBP35 family ATP-binding protein [Haloarculaceae archaeon]